MRRSHSLTAAPEANTSAKQLPFIFKYVLISTIVACAFGGGIEFLGFALQGYIWFFALLLAAVIVLQKFRVISFPWVLWLPWVVLITLYLIVARTPNALQRVAMMICPIAVGMAVSTFSASDSALSALRCLMDRCTLALFAFVAFVTGIIFTASLPDVTGLAAQVMTGALLSCVYAVRYLKEQSRSSLHYWLGLATLPLIAATRTGIIATAVTLPLSLAPMKLIKRVLVLGIASTLAVGVFYTERVQRKMFYSGQGTLLDMRLDNPDFRTTGRLSMWDAMKIEIEKKPWFGHGADATDVFLMKYVGFATHPHNDWARFRFDYGYVGTGIFLFCILAQTFHAYMRARSATGETQILFYAGASSFIPFVMFMTTDNIVLYCQFFGNLQFALLGFAYASLNTPKSEQADEEDNLSQQDRILRILRDRRYHVPLR